MDKDEVFVGIDISKAELDICVLENESPQWFTIANDRKSIRRFLKKHLPQGKAIIGMENTGRYTWPLLSVLEAFDHTVFVIPPLHLSKSLGLVRGKSDRIDAERICRFTLKNKDELREHIPQRAVIKELGVLLTERKRLMTMKGQLTRGIKELAQMENGDVKRQIGSVNRSLVKTLEEKIKKVEKMIRELVRSDSVLSEQDTLLRSVSGVGPVLSWNIIYRTNEFLSVTDPRKLACYAGVVPFEHSSGTSVKGKNRVSGYADRQFKSILHMAAMRATRIEGELREYYLRKVDEGKNKMSVLNAIRNKIIHRAFAVIRNQRPYENRLVLS
jgi:transposase